MRRTYSRERYLDRVALIREHVPDVRADDRHHRRLPGRDRGGLRADARRLRGGRLRRRLHVHLLAAARDRGGGADRGAGPARGEVERMERLVEVVQRRARERAQRFVGRTLDVLVEGPSRTDPSRLRGRSRHGKTVNFAGLAQPGELVPVEITGATSRRSRARCRSWHGSRPSAQGAASTPSGAYANMRSHAVGEPDDGRGAAGGAAGLQGAGGRPPLRRARGARDPLLRGAGEVGAQPRPGGVARCRSGGRSTRTGAAATPACTASPAPPTRTSTWTPAATSRSEIVVKVNAPEVLRAELSRPVVVARARGDGDEHRSRTSGPRVATGSCPASGRRCATPRRRARC